MEVREVRLSVSARQEPIALSWTMQVPEKEAQHEHAPLQVSAKRLGPDRSHLPPASDPGLGCSEPQPRRLATGFPPLWEDLWGMERWLVAVVLLRASIKEPRTRHEWYA